MRDSTFQPSAPPRKKDRSAWRRAVDAVHECRARATAALARAEKHILENFRQPPHGG